MKLVIDRKKWLRGPYSDPLVKEKVDLKGSALSSTKNGWKKPMRCCLGHYLLACGVPEAVLKMSDLSSETDSDEVPEWLAAGYSVENLLVDINDNVHISDKEREADLREIFSKYSDVEVKFTGPRLKIKNGKEILYEEE